MTEFFDTHMHIDDEKFNEDRDKIIKKIWDAGVTRAIDVGCDMKTSENVIKIAQENDFIYAACGLHPENVLNTIEDTKKEISKIKDLILKNKKVVAIGEIGLDYYWKNDNKQIQIEAFKEQIELANELKLPISIHTRDSIEDTILILKETKIGNSGVLHCCPFNEFLVKQGLKSGLYIAFGGTCTFKNSKNAEKIVQMVPLDKILIETDSPYLAPDPVRGTRNDSSNLKYIVKKLAEFKGIEEEKMAKITYENAMKLFFGKEERNA